MEETIHGSAPLSRIAELLLVQAAVLYIRVMGLTTRVTSYTLEALPAGPFIYAFWHSRLLFLVYSHRHRNIHVLVSKSRDGELIASAIHRLGFRTIRGSSSRAARESAVRMIRALRDNRVCGITPDGPKGPAGRVKDGISYIARKTGCPVVPIACAAKRVKLLPSWDRFLVPFPFNRAVVVTGKPLFIAASEELAAANRRIEEALHQITLSADLLARSL